MARLLYELVEDARVRLLKAGVRADEARLDAELLARHVLGWDRARFIANLRQPVPALALAAFEARLGRRERREPLDYIVGQREFWGRRFTVGPSVLVPRPETELIVEQALALAADWPPGGPRRVADIGAGSGCLAVTLALEWPTADVVAADIDQAALEVARENARLHGVAGRVTCVASDLCAGLDAPVDLIVSNPPYVPDADIDGLAPEVRDHEPRRALAGGGDGLAVVRRLVAGAAGHLVAGGAFVFEIGIGQRDEVLALPGLAVFDEVRVASDLQGIPRTVVARRRRAPIA